MAQIEQGGGDGKKKKGAQKKMQIHVDFTPMVDMNMLLITFFMLCTTMIKSQTLSVTLPAKPDPDKPPVESSSKVNQDDAITMILWTERDDQGNVKTDGEGKPMHTIYYYFGKPCAYDPATGQLTEPNKLKAERFIGNSGELAQGIRAILAERNADVLRDVNTQKQRWRNKEITDEEYQAIAKEIRNNKDKYPNRPVVSIKPTEGAAWAAIISAFDEMQINQISQYQLETLKPVDQAMLDQYKAAHPSE